MALRPVETLSSICNKFPKLIGKSCKMCLQEKVWGWYSIPLFRRRLGNFKLLLLDYFSTSLFVYYCIQSWWWWWRKSRIISSWIIFLASGWQLYTFKRNKLHFTDSWGCEAVYWSLFQGVHLFGHFFGTIPTLWGYVGPYFNFHSFFGSLLGIIPKKCPYLTFSFWYLNAIKQWTAVLNKQSPDEKVNNAFVPFANSIAARSCTSNGLLIVRRTIKKVYKR